MRRARAAVVAAFVAAGALGALADTDKQVRARDSSLAGHLRRAWMAVERGHSNREAAVLIIASRADAGAGRWRAVPVFDAAGYRTIRLEIPTGTLAILHTHPNHLGAEPSPADRRNADLLDIPTYTLTDRGVWRYDPRTRRSERVMYRLNWLESSSWEKYLEEQGGRWR